MPNSWFRLYAEIRRDPKVQTMPETFQLRLIWLFTLRCEGPTEKLSLDELTYGLGCNGDVTLETLHETFLSKGFIEKNWAVINWDKRQYVSDSSTDRVKKYREKQALKQSETFLKRPETQNETHQNRTETTAAKRGSRIPVEFMVTDIHREFARKHGFVNPDELIDNFMDHWRAKAGKDGVKLDWDAAFRTWMRNSINFVQKGASNGHVKESPQRAAARKAIAELDSEQVERFGSGSASQRLF